MGYKYYLDHGELISRLPIHMECDKDLLVGEKIVPAMSLFHINPVVKGFTYMIMLKDIHISLRNHALLE